MISFIRHIFLLNGNGYQLVEWCRLYFETTKRSLLQISTLHSRSGAAQAWKLQYDWCCAKIGIWCGKCRRKQREVMFFFLTVSMFTFQHQDNWCPRTGGVEMSVGAVLTRQDFNQKVSVSADSYITGENGVWFLSLGQNSSSLIPTSAGVSGLRLTNISAK